MSRTARALRVETPATLFQAFSDSFRYRRRRLPLWMHTARLRRNEECDGQETDAGSASPRFTYGNRGGIHFAAPDCRTAAPDCRTTRRQRGSARVRVMVESPVRSSAAPMLRSGGFSEDPHQYSRRSTLYDDVLTQSTRVSSRRHHTAAVTVQQSRLMTSTRRGSNTKPDGASVFDQPRKPCGSPATERRPHDTRRSHLR